ncbi:MAG TPA: histidine phosphatase family protein [Bacillota bacterium]|nr:histidine phosphatase family protein [Bacillota bacterium]
MQTHFYLIRHGETNWNREGKIQGHTDIPLNEEGISQAERVAYRLSNIPIDAICTSDLSRAVQTAKEINKFHPHATFLIYPELRERNYGQWEGMSFGEVAKRGAEKNHQKVQLTGIETLEQMQRRGIACLEQLTSIYPKHHIVVVSHGGFINAMLHYFSQGEHGPGKTKLENTSLNYVSYKQDQWVIHTINDTSHLGNESD